MIFRKKITNVSAHFLDNIDVGIDMNKKLLFTESHEWLDIQGETAIIGISDYAQGELGDIVHIDFTKEIGDTIDAEEIFATIESVKTVSDCYSPINGTITEINEELQNNSEIINSDPYEAGWIIKIKMTDSSEADKLMDEDKYKTFLSE